MTTDLSGRTLSRKFLLQRPIGVGGMATVYEAINTQIDKRVAVKVMKAQFLEHDTLLIRFQREARNAAQMNHPHIVQITDFDVDGDIPYIVMEYLEGRTLSDLRHNSGEALPWRRVVEICAQLCSALQYAHDRGLLHRDIKPSNVFVVETPGSTRDHIKLLDFGIAKLQQPDQFNREPLTSPSQVPGTAEYMAPEQARGVPCEARSDLYSLGVMMYRLLTGRLPFYGATQTETLTQHVLRAPTPLSALVPDIEIPPALEALVLKALAKLPEQRWNSAEALRDALLVLLGDPEQSTQVHASHISTPRQPSPDLATGWSIQAFEWRDRLLRRRRLAASFSGASLGLCAFMFLWLFPMPGVATIAGETSLPAARTTRSTREPPPASLGSQPIQRRTPPSPPNPTPPTPQVAPTTPVTPPPNDDIVLTADPQGTPPVARPVTPPGPRIPRIPRIPKPQDPRRLIETFLKNRHSAFRKCRETLPLSQSVVLRVDLNLEPSTGRVLDALIEESQRTKDYAICATGILRALKYPHFVADNGQLKGLELKL